MYRHIAETWQKIFKEKGGDIRSRAISWRRGPTIVRVERPSRLDRARRLGYKAKQGYIIVRTRVSKGGMRRQRPRAGRRPKHLGVIRIKAKISSKEVAERRAAQKYPNLRLINSYHLYDDGKYVWYEVLFVDPSHPAIRMK